MNLTSGYHPVTWCQTTGGYAREEVGCNRGDHDHHDVLHEFSPEGGQGVPIYRIDAPGTVYGLRTGTTARLVRYNTDDHGNAVLPVYDVRSANGDGHEGGLATAMRIWSRGALSQGTRRLVCVLAEGQRAPVGSLYVRPNGEAWRLTGYGLDWKSPPFSDLAVKPDWTVMLFPRAMTSGDTLPKDADLVWLP